VRPRLAGRAVAGHDGGVIRELARVVPAPPGKPVREGAARDQERARRLALRPGTWDRAQAADMRAGFDAAAGDWEASRGGYRRPVLADALARGGPFPPGLAVEIASGTGLLTPLVAAVWPRVAAVDLSGGMLARSAAVRPTPPGCRWLMAAWPRSSSSMGRCSPPGWPGHDRRGGAVAVERAG
jgi:hypothetical protein